MIRFGLAVLLPAFVILVCSCSGNLFTTFSNEVSDASLLFQAQQDVTNKNYTAALTLFPKMSTSYQKSEEVIALWGAAYAGAGGLDFLSLVNNLTSIGSTTFLTFLMQNLDAGTSAQVTDFQNSQTEMFNISTSYAGFNSNDLLELVVFAMADMGEIISSEADPTGTGSVTGGFSTCSGFSTAEVQEFGTSLNIAINGLTQLSADGVDFGPSLSTFTGACSTLGTVGASYNFCTVAYGDTFTADQLTALEAIMGDDSIIGIGACGGTISGGTCCGI
jgi:hypothetical protein